MQSTFELNVPTGDGDLLITLTSGTSTHFVGANGSGKTRLAVYIENKLLDRAHRISAHRALTLNPTVAKISEGKARKGLRFGHPDESIGDGYRTSHRCEREKEATRLFNEV